MQMYFVKREREEISVPYEKCEADEHLKLKIVFFLEFSNQNKTNPPLKIGILRN